MANLQGMSSSITEEKKKGSIDYSLGTHREMASKEKIESKYGKYPEAWRVAGVASLAASQALRARAEHLTRQEQISAIDKRQQEISDRADISISNLIEQSKQVQSSQTAALVKGGVKLEGSGISMLTQTAIKAGEAAKVREREANFLKSQLQMQKEMTRLNMKYATYETLLDVGMTAAVAYSGKS